VKGTMVQGTRMLGPRNSYNGAGILYERDKLQGMERINAFVHTAGMFLIHIFKILGPNKP
jgi:hypothetical protein